MFSQVQNAPLSYLQAAASVLAFFAARIAWRRRERTPGAHWLALSMWAASYWCAWGAIELSVVSLEAKTLASQLSYLGITLSPVALWFFAHEHANAGLRPHRYVTFLIWAQLVIANLVVLSNGMHHLFWSDVRMVESHGLVNALYERGPWFWLNTGITYALSLSTAMMMLAHAFASQRAARLQNALVVLALLCPLGMSLVYMFRVPVIGEVDNTPVGLVATGLLLLLGMGRYGLLRSFPLIGNILLERMPDPVLVTDLDGNLVHANPAARARFGLSFDEFALSPLALVLGKWPVLCRAMLRARDADTTRFEEAGAWFEMLSSTVPDRRGHPRGLMHVLRDTTELRRAAERADANAAAARRASDAKSLFIAQLSHDFRTPMHAILGTLDLLEAQGGAGTGHGGGSEAGDLVVIREAAQGLLNLVNGLLDVSRIESGRVDLVERPYYMAEVVGPIEHVLGVIARAKGLSLRCSIAPEAGGCLLGDPERLRQVLFNIVGNAIKFTRLGHVELEASVQQGGAAASLRIQISDTGPGIPASRLERVFDAYDRGDPEFARRHEGTGLGLSICRKLVQAMRGDIEVESREGKGSRFVVVLPLARAETAPSSPDLEDKAALGLTPKGIGGGERLAGAHTEIPGKAPLVLRVIVADDDPLSLRVTAAHLRRCGCEVEEAANGLEVLQLFKQQGCDLLVLDGFMPELDGWEANRLVVEHANMAGVPVPEALAVSADLRPESLEHWRSVGVTRFLPKPFSGDSLRAALEALPVRKR